MVNVAVVGCGYWGRNLVRNFAALNSLAAIYDTDQALSEKLASEHGTCYRPLEDIFQDSSIQGIVIATPPLSHKAIAEQALRAHKHILVEKPLALTSRDAESLCQLAQQQERVLMVGHVLQYHPGFMKLQEMVKQGRLGKLQYVYSNRLNLGKFRQHENILWDLAPHDLSMILSLVGIMPDSVFTTGHCHVNTRIADLTTTHLTFPGGINGHIFLSWLHPYKEHKLIAVGEEGMAVFDDGADWSQKLQLYEHRVLWTDGTPVPERAEVSYISLTPEEPLLRECEHFLTCIEANQLPRTGGWDALSILQVLEAADQSMELKKPVSFPVPFSRTDDALQGPSLN